MTRGKGREKKRTSFPASKTSGTTETPSLRPLMTAGDAKKIPYGPTEL